MFPLKDPLLVGAWPGMGGVAVAAASYLVETLEARPVATIDGADHFDIDKVRLEDGVVVPPRLPITRLYAWKNPGAGRDLIIVVGEAQPGARSYDYCRRVLRAARELGARRVVTFASMVVPIHPSQPSQVHLVGTSKSVVEEALRASPGARSLGDGEIAGLNGTFLAAAAEQGLEGVGMLADVPPMAVGVPYLKASQAVLEAFIRSAGIELDLEPMARQASMVEQGLVEVLDRIQALQGKTSDIVGVPGEGEEELETLEAHEPAEPAPPEKPRLPPEAVARIEALFLEAAEDRSKATELKAELDRHGVFKEFEDRFLNLFSKRQRHA